MTILVSLVLSIFTNAWVTTNNDVRILLQVPRRLPHPNQGHHLRGHLQLGRCCYPERCSPTYSVIEKKTTFDYRRNFNLFLAGSCYIAPMLHFWYCKMLPRIAAPLLPSSTIGQVFGKMAIDQLLFAPLILSGFYIFLTTVSDGDPMKGVGLIRDKLWETLVANWKIWPLAMTFNFWLMPMKYQVLFANVVGFFWNIILSYIAYK